MYPIGSRPEQFYVTANVHKLQSRQNVYDLTLRRIISNLGTASYETVKYSTALLALFSKSENTIYILQTSEKRIWKKIPDGYKMVSFDGAISLVMKSSFLSQLVSGINIERKQQHRYW